ncbi:hypothetical protein LIPSTDRAFT_310232 [Lipomyces starkeyi NRRL Y-11557]|uniref:Uncharacterized protein n=1 Tax=Lipomyces starkeyi NRRL Y-11557 TaxID=675824 RepID=A0A1E3Q2G5_LIPST|nr:hypothetical protein LIPSTDRAFT_310232 [Lipomyces starkeyi NRRL Y-11557]
MHYGQALVQLYILTPRVLSRPSAVEYVFEHNGIILHFRVQRCEVTPGSTIYLTGTLRTVHFLLRRCRGVTVPQREYFSPVHRLQRQGALFCNLLGANPSVLSTITKRYSPRPSINQTITDLEPYMNYILAFCVCVYGSD